MASAAPTPVTSDMIPGVARLNALRAQVLATAGLGLALAF